MHFRDAAGTTCRVPVELTPFLTEEDYENLQCDLEDYMDLPDGGAVVRATRSEEQLQTWGQRWQAALFSAPENSALRQALLAGPEPRELPNATPTPPARSANPSTSRKPTPTTTPPPGSPKPRATLRRRRSGRRNAMTCGPNSNAARGEGR